MASNNQQQQPLSKWVFLNLSLLASLFHLSRGDVGIAARYGPPYLPTACFGNNQAQFPSTNFFAAAGEGIWENGASCGRKYLVKCISASVPRACVPGKVIEVRIVDRAQTSVSRPSANTGAMVLSTTAFAAIAKVSLKSINIEYIPT